MSNQLSAKLTADVKGYKKAIEDAKNSLKVFNAEESAAAQTMRKVYDVSNDQVKAYKKVLDSMTKATDGTKTMKQASNLLKNDLERLQLQWANLSDSAKNSNFGRNMANSIRQAESQLKSMQSQMSTVNTATQSTGVSLSSVVGIIGRFAPALAVGSTALKGLKDAFFNSESNIDEWGRTVEAAKGTYQVFLDTLNNGNWSEFFGNVGKAQKEMKALYDLYDLAGSTNTNNQIAIAQQEKKLADLRRQQAEGKNVGKQIKDTDRYLRTLKMQGSTADKNAGYQGMVTALGADIPEKVRKAVIDAFMKGGQDFMNYAAKRSKELEGVGGRTQAQELEYKALKALVEKESNAELQKGMQSYLKGLGAETQMDNASRKYASSIKNASSAPAAAVAKTYAEGSVGYFEDKIAEANKELKDALDSSTVEAIKSRIAEYQSKLDELLGNTPQRTFTFVEYQKSYKQQKPTAVTPKNTLGDIQDRVGQMQSLNSSAQSLYDTLNNIGEMDNPFQFFDGIFNIINGVTSAVQTVQSLGDALQKMSAISSATTATEIANAAAKSTASGEEAAAATTAATAETFKAHSAIPFVGIAIATAMVGAMIASIVASKNKVPKFAKGGLISGPTVGLMGEYSGASNNPEVVAPLDKLKGMIADVNGGGGEVRFQIDGRTLVGILNKETRLTSRR